MLRRNLPFLNSLRQSHIALPSAIDSLWIERATELSGDAFAYATLPQAGHAISGGDNHPQ